MRRKVKERGMLLRLPKPLNLKNSVKEKGVVSLGLLLAQCDDGGVLEPLVLGWGRHGALCSLVSPCYTHICSPSLA